MDTYPYTEMILSPTQIGVSDAGNLGALSTDIRAMTSYVDVLMSGQSNAQVVSPLGNKYFLDTGMTCKDKDGADQQRYAYVNNIPDDFIAGRGLVSGIIQDVLALNPVALFGAFSGKEDPCQQITMETRDNANVSKQESRYVNQSDITQYNACWFPNKTNPVNKKVCREGMENRKLPKDPVVQVYMVGIGCIAAFAVYRFMKK